MCSNSWLSCSISGVVLCGIEDVFSVVRLFGLCRLILCVSFSSGCRLCSIVIYSSSASNGRESYSGCSRLVVMLCVNSLCILVRSVIWIR